MGQVSVGSTVSEERLMAAVCHSASLLPGVGMIAPLEIWLTQRKWSRFVTFHALQALAYQLFGLLVLALLSIPGALLLPLNLWMLMAQIRDAAAAGFAVSSLLLSLWMMVMIAAALFLAAVGLRAGVRILRGRDHSYPMIGRWLEDYVQDEV